MIFQFNFYSSILLIFFVHGLVYAALLWRKGIKNESRSEKWLAAFLVLCILYIAPWMVGFAGWYDNQPYRDMLFYIPMQHLFFVGPVIFFYVQSLLNPSFVFGRKQWLHLLPGLLYLAYCLVVFITDKLVLHEYYFLVSQADPDFDLWYQIAGFLSMLIYFFVCIRYFGLFQKLMMQVVSYADVLLFKWVRNFLYAFFAMLLVRLLFYIASFIPAVDKLDYVGPWWEYLSFAIIFYYIAITGYSNSIETKVPFRMNLLRYKPALLLPASTIIAAQETAVEDAEVIEIEDVQTTKNEDSELLKEWKPKIEAYIMTGRAFEDPELTLSQVAKALNTNPSLISKVINQGFQLNFNDFINYYRIKAVKEKLKAGELKTQTMLGIAYDCGFNSKATFNRAFKKATGLSPKDWVEKNNGSA